MARTKTVTELTVEQQIAQIQKEAQDKIKELRSKLPWNQRFKTTFTAYTKNNSHKIVSAMNGYEVDSSYVSSINEYLKDQNLSLVYNSATFDNPLYHQKIINSLVYQYDLSEYPVYTVFAVLEDTVVKGYIQINCNYSSYNGNDYSGWHFVQPKEITCTVFTEYNP